MPSKAALEFFFASDLASDILNSKYNPARVRFEDIVIDLTTNYIHVPIYSTIPRDIDQFLSIFDEAFSDQIKSHFRRNPNEFKRISKEDLVPGKSYCCHTLASWLAFLAKEVLAEQEERDGMEEQARFENEFAEYEWVDYSSENEEFSLKMREPPLDFRKVNVRECKSPNRFKRKVKRVSAFLKGEGYKMLS